jgi:hypothetical protein
LGIAQLKSALTAARRERNKKGAKLVEKDDDVDEAPEYDPTEGAPAPPEGDYQEEEEDEDWQDQDVAWTTM